MNGSIPPLPHCDPVFVKHRFTSRFSYLNCTTLTPLTVKFRHY